MYFDTHPIARPMRDASGELVLHEESHPLLQKPAVNIGAEFGKLSWTILVLGIPPPAYFPEGRCRMRGRVTEVPTRIASGQ